jgi:hypothetical protein
MSVTWNICWMVVAICTIATVPDTCDYPVWAMSVAAIFFSAFAIVVTVFHNVTTYLYGAEVSKIEDAIVGVEQLAAFE